MFLSIPIQIKYVYSEQHTFYSQKKKKRINGLIYYTNVRHVTFFCQSLGKHLNVSEFSSEHS